MRCPTMGSGGIPEHCLALFALDGRAPSLATNEAADLPNQIITCQYGLGLRRCEARRKGSAHSPGGPPRLWPVHGRLRPLSKRFPPSSPWLRMPVLELVFASGPGRHSEGGGDVGRGGGRVAASCVRRLFHVPNWMPNGVPSGPRLRPPDEMEFVDKRKSPDVRSQPPAGII